jgi:polygalacturonase
MDKKSLRLSFVAFVLVIVSSLVTARQFPSLEEIKSYVTGLPFAMEVPDLPKIPDRVFKITDFGAIGDGQTMNTKAIDGALLTCSNAGGGVVIIPPGVWLTGPIEMRSNIELRAEHGALIIFTKKIEDYPMWKRGDPKSKRFRFVSPIYGSNLEHIAITGGGVFNGSGEVWRPLKKEKATTRQWKDIIASGGVVDEKGDMWWPSKEAMNGEKYLAEVMKKKNPTAEEFAGAREFLRPNMIVFVNCRNVLFDGITFENSPMFCLNPVECEDVVIRNVNIRNEWWAQNGDGIDIGSCHNVLIYKTVVSAGDDGICLKPGGYDKKRGWKVACENIVIADCAVYRGHGGFVIGSETYGGVRNVAVRNLTCIETDVGLRFKSSRDKGGLVEKVFINGVYMKDIADQAILFDTYYAGGSPESRTKEKLLRAFAELVTDRTPNFNGLKIENIFCNGADRAILLNGLPEMPIRNVEFKNITISATKGLWLTEAEGITFTDITILSQKGAPFVVSHSRNIAFEKVSGPATGKVFLSVNGESCKNITVQKTNHLQYEKGWELGAGVPSDAVREQQ